jgi:hypothetical protein
MSDQSSPSGTNDAARNWMVSMAKYRDDKPLWDALISCRQGAIGRLNHSEIEHFLADLDMHGYAIVKKPD